MKNSDFQTTGFRNLTINEIHTCTGGGFAFDAGRFIRFNIIAFGGAGINVANAIGDAIYNHVK